MIRIEHFHRSMLDDPAYQAEHARVSELCGNTRTYESLFCLANLPAGCHRGLEVGGWPLFMSRAFKERSEHWIATDSFEWECEFPAAAVGNVSSAEWLAEMGYGVETEQADVCDLRWPSKFFDCAIAVSVLEHCPDDFLALHELCRVARRVIITTDLAPASEPYCNRARVYSPESLGVLIEMVTEQQVEVGAMPPPSCWMYEGRHNVAGFVIDP